MDSAIVIVRWVDAHVDGSWEQETDGKLADVTTVGFLVKETDESLVIASTVSPPMHNCRITIPKAWIKERKVIKLETKQRKSKRKKLSAVGQRPNHSCIPIRAR
jgi:hypothetical protein